MLKTTVDTEVAIVGAGPYGLSLAAHLTGLGVDHRIFGVPLSTWRFQMPTGMHLKSDGFASSLSAPGAGWTLRDYCAERGVRYHDTDERVALSTFVDYGLAFQDRFVPHLEQRQVTSVAPVGTGWRVELDDGSAFIARRVAMAVGITHYEHIPDLFAELPRGWVSHSGSHAEFSRFRDRDVAVIGSGSSAVEMALGLAAAGARPRMVSRRLTVPFGRRPRPDRGLVDQLLHPPSGLGNGMRSRLACDAPDVFRMLPAAARLAIVGRHLGPSSPWDLQERVAAEVEVLLGHEPVGVGLTGDRVRLEMATSGVKRTLEADHVICATGYRAEVRRLEFLDAGVRRALRTVGGSPVLSPAFESSAPGLHFLGLSAAASFGPLMRFMFGDDFAARRVSGSLKRTRA